MGRRRARVVATIASVCVAHLGALGCSSSSNGGAHDGGVDGAHDGGREAAHEDAIPDATQWEANVPDALLSVSDAFADVAAMVDPLNCVAPSTPSNEAGVGGYCSPGGGQCNHAAPDAAPTICTADFGAPAHLWFCTVSCTSAAQCGTGSALCVAAAGETACVPSACAAFAADASTSDASDAGTTDGASDAPAPVDANAPETGG